MSENNSPPPPAKAEWYADGLSFTCTQCGNCCTGPPGYVWVNDEEAARLAGLFNLDVPTFLKTYAHRVGKQWTLNEQPSEHGLDCVFLKRDEQGKALCGVYQARPSQCRTWPFWPENLRTPRTWQATVNFCPGAGTGKHYPIEQIRILRDSEPGNTHSV